MSAVDGLRIKLFADTANLEQIRRAGRDPLIRGVTTNPLLLHKAGVRNYAAFATEAAKAVAPKPISFEVFSDDLWAMEEEAKVISSWGPNIVVKVPITNTKGIFTGDVIGSLAADGISVNVTAIFTVEQVEWCVAVLGQAKAILSIFAGRIADAWRDPEETIRDARGIAPQNLEILWASPRESFNIWQAERAGADIITVDPNILDKLNLVGKDMKDFSLETVAMFYNAGKAAGFRIIDPVSYGGGGFG